MDIFREDGNRIEIKELEDLEMRIWN